LILKGNLRFPVAISNEAKHLIESLLVVEPEKRISISQILRHPWLKDAIDGIDNTVEDDMHDFEVAQRFQRDECNFNPLSLCVAGSNDELESARLEPHETNPMAHIGNINVMNLDNLFSNESPAEVRDPSEKAKLSYNNYCAVTQDNGTHHIDEEALRVLDSFGYPRSLVI